MDQLTKRRITIIFGLVFGLWLSASDLVQATSTPAQGWLIQLSKLSTTKEVVIDAMLDSPTASINAIEGSFSYPTNILTFTRADSNSSDLKLWAKLPQEGTPGAINFIGGTPTPGLSGTHRILRLYFAPKAAGTGIIQATTSARVFINDGQATILPVRWSPLSITTSTANPLQPFDVITTSPPVAPWVRVTSSSHPQPNVWYSNQTADLNFETDAATTLWYTLDQKPEATPNATKPLPITNNKLQLRLPSDGIWYVHITPKTKNQTGLINNFPLWIDTTPPIIIIKPKSLSLTNPAMTWDYSATDTTSGVALAELISSASERSVVPVTGSITLTKKLASATLIATDQAGNSSTAIIKPRLWLPAFFLNPMGLVVLLIITLIMLIVWIWLLFHAFHPQGRRLRRAFG